MTEMAKYMKKSVVDSEIQGKLLLKTGRGTIHIDAVSDNICHVIFTMKNNIKPSAVGYKSYEPSFLHVSQQGVDACTKCIKAIIDPTSGEIKWYRKGENRASEETSYITKMSFSLEEYALKVWTADPADDEVKSIKTVDGERNLNINLHSAVGEKAYRGKIFFSFDNDEQIHGLGQGEDGIFDYRNKTQYLYQHNMRTPMPVLISTKGYGIVVDCGSLMTFKEYMGKAFLKLDAVDQIDFYFICGKNIDEIVSGVRSITGKASMLPKWAFGYIQSKERYESQRELLDVAYEYRKRNIGLDCVVQDWQYWPAGGWGYKKVDKERYPDIVEMKNELHRLNVHSMVSIWPNVGVGNSDHDEMDKNGFLLADKNTVNVFDENARRLYWKQAEKELFKGFDSWWCDSTEPFTGSDWNGEIKRKPKERFDLVGGDCKKYLGAKRANLYALYQAKGIYENQRKADSAKRMFNLTRSGYSGSQKYGAVLWSGDICATWETLKNQIVEGLNMAMSGYPYWTLDIGAFFVVNKNYRHRGCGSNMDPGMKWFWQGDYEDGIDDPAYCELYVRWFQLGEFLPIFRSHGTDTPREIWRFGKPGNMFYDALIEADAERYRLMPYIYSLAGQVHLFDGTIMRSLLFDFPEDATATKISDEYMFGSSMLICPVTEAYYYEKGGKKLEKHKKRCCYLPEGTEWYDFRTGDKYAGGIYINAYAPISHIPVFVREGSIIPMEQSLMYAEEVVETPFEIRIYPGRDGEFLYYEDAGEGYEYENGDYNVIPMRWNNEDGIFYIGKAEHKYENTIAGRKINLIIPGQPLKQFVYEGNEVEIVCRT